MPPFLRPRPDQTLLILDEDKALRMDLRRGAAAYEVTWMHRAEEEAHRENPLRLLAHRKPSARQVTLLTHECASVTVELPSYGLGTDNLDEVLAMEAEQLTGQSRESCDFAYLTLKTEGDLKTFRIVQMDYARLVSYRNEVAAFRGCTLAGLGHPAPAGAADDEGIPWNDPAALEAWADRWAGQFRVLDGRVQGVPLIPVPPKPVGMRQQVAIGAAALLGGLALVGLDSFVNLQKLQSLRAELEAIESPANRGRELNEEINRLRRELTRAPTAAGGGALHRARLAALLHELQEGLQAEAMLTGIRQPEQMPQITLLAASPEAAHRVEQRLSRRMESIGWRMRTAEREALHLWPDGGPHRLQIQLEPGMAPVAAAGGRS